MIHTVQIFSVVNETEVVVFLELPCFLSFNYLMNVGNLVSGSSASLNVYTRNSIPIFSPQSYTITFIIFVSYFFLCCFFLISAFYAEHIWLHFIVNIQLSLWDFTLSISWRFFLLSPFGSPVTCNCGFLLYWFCISETHIFISFLREVYE